MTPYYADDAVTLHHGDALEVLRQMPDASVDAVVTDPPYGLEFMGREWDGADGFRRSLNPADAGRDSVFGRASRTSPEYRTGKPSNARIRTRVDGRTNPAEGKSTTSTLEAYVAGPLYQQWCQAWAAECLRVLKPGGHMLAFGGTRTAHRLTCAIEDAGFEIRDSIMWHYGSGFPKSLNVGAAITTAAGLKPSEDEWPASAKAWRGWGTALKPATEPIVMARKPLAGTVAANVQAYGTGALNIDATRVPTADHLGRPVGAGGSVYGGGKGYTATMTEPTPHNAAGRWPSNVVLSHAPDCEVCECGWRGPYDEADNPHDLTDDCRIDLDCVPGCPVWELDRQSGVLTSGKMRPTHTTAARSVYGQNAAGGYTTMETYGDSGGASRFFPVFRYEAKAPTAERPRTADGTAHPTVKPLDLMRWLVRLVTPAGGTVLEPFAGSGTTAEACVLEGLRCIAIEREAAYLPLIVGRLTKPLQPSLDLGGVA